MSTQPWGPLKYEVDYVGHSNVLLWVNTEYMYYYGVLIITIPSKIDAIQHIEIIDLVFLISHQ